MEEIGFSGKQINKAGELFLDEDTFNDDEKFVYAMDVLSFWRFSHNKSLENAFIKLQAVVLKKDSNAIWCGYTYSYLEYLEILR